MRRINDKNLKALIITLIIISLMSVLSLEENSFVSSGINAVTKGLFQVSAAAAASLDSASSEEIKAELERLESENAELRNQLSDYLETKRENERLKKLLDIKKDNPSYKMTPANVIKRDVNDDFYSFTLDEGTSRGISVNNPVITENGLVGWVCQADASTCKVKTILSPDTKAGAADKQSGDNGIINGSAALCEKNKTSMTTLAENNKIKKGDMIVTSGDGGVYPGGLLIGEVESVEFNSYDASRYAVIKPYEDVRYITSAAVITDFGTKGKVKGNEKQ
ncbi:MAG TPA: rod shape-determining protein MreC [Ruminococcaceae bacterium]|nr:rod shape-determining protein MreC [Oscillospiraceae bacterium]